MWNWRRRQYRSTTSRQADGSTACRRCRRRFRDNRLSHRRSRNAAAAAPNIRRAGSPARRRAATGRCSRRTRKRQAAEPDRAVAMLSAPASMRRLQRSDLRFQALRQRAGRIAIERPARGRFRGRWLPCRVGPGARIVVGKILDQNGTVIARQEPQRREKHPLLERRDRPAVRTGAPARTAPIARAAAWCSRSAAGSG